LGQTQPESAKDSGTENIAAFCVLFCVHGIASVLSLIAPRSARVVREANSAYVIGQK
jgi:hypothetical protein